MERKTSDFPQDLSAHRPALLRHCYRMLGSFADAEDLVQDALLQAWRARDTYAGDAPIEHWLFRIATNACLNELTRRKRRGLPQLERPAARPADPLEAVEAASWLTPAPDAKLFEGPARELEPGLLRKPGGELERRDLQHRVLEVEPGDTDLAHDVDELAGRRRRSRVVTGEPELGHALVERRRRVLFLSRAGSRTEWRRQHDSTRQQCHARKESHARNVAFSAYLEGRNESIG